MPLTDAKIRGTSPGSRTFKMADQGGLYLEVTPRGSKLWRYKFRINGKAKVLSLGKYPDVPLKRAREKHQEARQQLAEGVDPAAAKQLVKQAKRRTFGAMAREWFDVTKNKWTPNHQHIVWRRLEMNVLPWLKDRPIGEISTREILEVLRKVEARGAVETAHRTAQVVSQVFVYSVASGVAEHNPAGDLNKALQPYTKKRLPGITDPERIKELLRAIDGFEGSFVVLSALRFLPLVFVRPGELRKAEWSEIDFQQALWTIPAHRMKKKREHLVPLSRQALEILRELYPLTGDGKYIFPAVRTPARPMSEGTLNAALQRLGFSKMEHVPHGFRTTASTRLHEMGWSSRIIEIQLAHVDQNKTRDAYNRAEHLQDRYKMMQAWADYLDALKSDAKILSFVSSNT